MRINLTASAELCRSRSSTGNGAVSAAASSTSPAARPIAAISPAHWHYAASKAGMVAMTKSIARGYAAQGILAFAVCPGFTMTGMAEDYLASRGGDKLLADIPLGRVGDARGSRRDGPLARHRRPAVDDRRGARRERGLVRPVSSWKVTLPCTRAEAEAIDAADDIAIDAVLMTTEEVEDDRERWRLDAYFEAEPDAAALAAIARAGAERDRRDRWSSSCPSRIG